MQQYCIVSIYSHYYKQIHSFLQKFDEIHTTWLRFIYTFTQQLNNNIHIHNNIVLFFSSVIPKNIFFGV